MASGKVVTERALRDIVSKWIVCRSGSDRARRFFPREAGLAAVAGGLVLIASLVNFLRHNEYPLFRLEVGIVVIGLFGLSLLVGLIYAGAGKYGRGLLQVLLVYVALDLNFDGLFVPLGTLATVIVLNRHIVPVLGITACVVLVTEMLGSMVGSGPRTPVSGAAGPRPERPALLHIILDEHIGVEGLLGGDRESAAMRERLRDFYIGNGFRLYGGAYSEYFHTANAIPQILNFGVQQRWTSENPHGMSIERSAYFSQLHSFGYKPQVFQTDFLKYCSAAESTSCRQYRQQDLGPIAKTSLEVTDRSKLILYNFIWLSYIGRTAGLKYDQVASRSRRYGVNLPRVDVRARRRVDSVGALNMLDELVGSLRDAKSGDAYFAHVLIPHDPYSLRSDCSLKPLEGWQTKLSKGANPDEVRSAYFEQIGCVLEQLKRAIEALRGSEAGENFVIIVHGDHGYRDSRPEPSVENIGRFSDKDLVLGHSTLFAVYSAGVAAGYDDRRMSVSTLLTAFVQTGFQSLDVRFDPDSAPSVVLSDRQWRPVQRYPLPRWWAAPQEYEPPGAPSHTRAH